MDKYFTQLRNMFGAVQLVMLEFIAEWTGYLPLTKANDDFNAKVTELDETVTYQQLNIKGYAIKKQKIRDSMAKIVVVVSKKIRAFAAAQKDSVLLKEMQIPRSMIMQGRSARALVLGEQVINALDRLTATEKTEYDITAAQITLLTESVENFRKVLAEPRVRAAQRKTASDKIPSLLTEITTLLAERMDNLVENYSGTTYYADYKNSRRILTQIRHTVILGNVTSPGGSDLKNVHVKMTGKDKQTGETVVAFEEMTNVDGNYSKSALNPELNWDVEFVLPNYVPQKFESIDLERGAIDRIDVTLVPVV